MKSLIVYIHYSCTIVIVVAKRDLTVSSRMQKNYDIVRVHLENFQGGGGNGDVSQN